MKLSKAELGELEKIFDYCINYDSDDFDAPIDPLSYIDSNGDNCLHIAAFRSDLRAVELLLKGGVNVNSLGDMEQTALDYAKRKASAEVVNCLLKNGGKSAKEI